MANQTPNLLGRIEDQQNKRNVLYSLGGAGFAFNLSGTIIYVDPFLADQDPSRPFHRAIPPPFYAKDARIAHAILSTHEHNDHCNVDTIGAFSSNTKAVFIGPFSSCNKVEEWGYPLSRIVRLAASETHDLGNGVKISAFESSDPYAESALMLMIRTKNLNILHSGDTSYFGGFADIGSKNRVDVALLNFGKQIPTPDKPYYMNAEKVVRAASDLNTRMLIPMHWDIFVEVKEDPSPILPKLKSVRPDIKLKIIKAGEGLELD